MPHGSPGIIVNQDLLSALSAMLDKGDLSSQEDFPLYSARQNGWFYIVQADVVDPCGSMAYPSAESESSSSDSSEDGEPELSCVEGSSFASGTAILWHQGDWFVFGTGGGDLINDPDPRLSHDLDARGYNILNVGLLRGDPVAVPPGVAGEGDLYLDDGTNTETGVPGWRVFVSGVWQDAFPAPVEIPEHNQLSGIQGGQPAEGSSSAAAEHYHLTAVEHDTLVGGGNADDMHTHAPHDVASREVFALSVEYVDDTNKVILLSTQHSIQPEDVLLVSPYGAGPQQVEEDWTARKAIDGSLYLCLDPLSTCPAESGAFDGGTNPNAGIADVLESGDILLVLYKASEATAESSSASSEI